jgi:hypothetical protein
MDPSCAGGAQLSAKAVQIFSRGLPEQASGDLNRDSARKRVARTAFDGDFVLKEGNYSRD